LKTILPPASGFLLFCRPSERQYELYKTITSNSRATGSFSGALVTLTALRKLCSPSLQRRRSAADNVDSSRQLSCLVSWLSLMLYFGPFGRLRDKVVVYPTLRPRSPPLNPPFLIRATTPINAWTERPICRIASPWLTHSTDTPEQSFCLLLSSKSWWMRPQPDRR
jgi:hypothetical protein